MGAEEELRNLAGLLQEQGLAEAFSAIHFRSRSERGVMGQSQVVFCRNDDGRELVVPYATAVDVLCKASSRGGEAVWAELAFQARNRNRTIAFRYGTGYASARRDLHPHAWRPDAARAA